MSKEREIIIKGTALGKASYSISADYLSFKMVSITKRYPLSTGRTNLHHILTERYLDGPASQDYIEMFVKEGATIEVIGETVEGRTCHVMAKSITVLSGGKKI